MRRADPSWFRASGRAMSENLFVILASTDACPPHPHLLIEIKAVAYRPVTR